MKEETRAAILREVVDLVQSHSGLRDDEFTTEEYAAARGADDAEAYRELKRELVRGNLTKRAVTIDGHVRCAWKRVVSVPSDGTIESDSD